MISMRRYLLLLLALPFFQACQSGESPQQQTPPAADTDLSDFYAFYQSFHLDSTFQMEHIIFPLQGLPSNADSLTIARNDFYWQAEDWKPHRPVDFETSEYKREITPLSEDIVVEKIIHRSGQTGMMRRFVRMGDDWYLIYFADLNRVKNN
jgi:hypothetical protein